MIRLLVLLALAAACQRTPAQVATDGALGPPLRSDVRRVVTLAPSLTEIVLALGAADRLVGVTRFDDAPEVAKVTRVGGYSDPSAETIVRLAPHVVLCQPSPGNKGAVYFLAESGIPVRFFPLETLTDTTRSITEIGALLALVPEAKQLVADLEGARRRARDAAARRPRRPRVALLVGIDPLVAAGPGSFLHELLVDAGAIDIVEASATPYPKLSLERLLSQQPDVILLAGSRQYGVDPAALPAPLAARAIFLKSPGFLRPGPLVAGALDELAGLLDTLAASPAP